MTSHHLTALGGALAVLLFCGACATNQPADPTSAPPEPSASATATPAPTPTTPALDLDDPASWVIGFDSVGPLTIGGSISAERVGMTAFSDDSQPEACALVVFRGIAPDVPSVWAQPDADPDVIDVIVVTGDGEAAPYSTGSPKTAEGVGIGATEAEVLAAYPGITEQPSEVVPDFSYYAVSDDSGRYIDFTVDPAGLVESSALSDQSVPPYEYCG
jgi:hypothetical protein